MINLFQIRLENKSKSCINQARVTKFHRNMKNHNIFWHFPWINFSPLFVEQSNQFWRVNMYADVVYTHLNKDWIFPTRMINIIQFCVRWKERNFLCEFWRHQLSVLDFTHKKLFSFQPQCKQKLLYQIMMTFQVFRYKGKFLMIAVELWGILFLEQWKFWINYEFLIGLFKPEQTMMTHYIKILAIKCEQLDVSIKVWIFRMQNF